MKPPASSGFILFEVMIAVAVFAIVALSLASAMNSTIQASTYLDRQASIRMGLDSMIHEALRKPKRQEMAFEYEDETLGVRYRTEIEELRFTTFEGESLPHLYLLRVTARYEEDGEDREDKVERYVYRTT
jgi:type II secretory pathway pseudopilin PulG